MQYESRNEEEAGVRDEVTMPATVLVVDDSEELLAVLEEILQATGYNAILASSADDAIRSLSDQIPDIIVCDVMMPSMNGFEFHKVVQENPEWSEIPFVYLTALSGADDIRAGKSTGCDDYLTKPFDPNDLVAVIKGKLTIAEHRRRMHGLRFEGYRRRIIHTLSHEFRTPLVSINTGAELLCEQHNNLDSGSVERLLNSIQRGGQRLERLVNDFMLLQQIDLGQTARMFQRYRYKISLYTIAETSIECFRETLPDPDDAQIELVKEPYVDPRAINVCVYDVHIVNVVQRLLNNAYKFAGSDKKITVHIRQEGDRASVSVRDRGPGLDKHTRSRAFEMFAQIDRETYEQQGCGLGLTIATHLATLNGGQLSFYEPADGVGLEVELSFPIVE